MISYDNPNFNQVGVSDLTPIGYLKSYTKISYGAIPIQLINLACFLRKIDPNSRRERRKSIHNLVDEIFDAKPRI